LLARIERLEAALAGPAQRPGSGQRGAPEAAAAPPSLAAAAL